MKKLYLLALICAVMSLSSFTTTEIKEIPASECYDRAESASIAYGNAYDLDHYNEYLYFIDHYDMCMQWATN